LHLEKRERFEGVHFLRGSWLKGAKNKREGQGGEHGFILPALDSGFLWRPVLLRLLLSKKPSPKVFLNFKKLQEFYLSCGDKCGNPGVGFCFFRKGTQGEVANESFLVGWWVPWGLHGSFSSEWACPRGNGKNGRAKG
jgi:hypothetical protein